MNTRPDLPAPEQRKALEQSEKRASEQHPENFKDQETKDKVVEILPIAKDGSAIRGIDPDK